MWSIMKSQCMQTSSDVVISQPTSEEQKTRHSAPIPLRPNPKYITSSWRETGLDSYSSTLPQIACGRIILDTFDSFYDSQR